MSSRATTLLERCTLAPSRALCAMDNTLNTNLARLRSQAHLIRTSIEALIGQARFQAVLRWEEVLFQFNTLQRQMDDLRDEIVALPILSYFLLAPKRLPTNPDDSARAASRRSRAATDGDARAPRSPDDAEHARAPGHGGGLGRRARGAGAAHPHGASRPSRRAPRGDAATRLARRPRSRRTTRSSRTSTRSSSPRTTGGHCRPRRPRPRRPSRGPRTSKTPGGF